MMKKLMLAGALLGAVALAGCDEQQVQLYRTQLQVVIPPEQLYQCPVLRNLPAYKTLTDLQVARVLVELHRNNLTCRASLDAIRAFLANAQITAQAGNTPLYQTAQRIVGKKKK